MEKSLKIRHWFLGQIYAAGNSSVKLESVRETARRFNVAQCTVSGVTAALIRDGWLIPKKGIGIYTNPQKLAKDSAKKLVGFINGDGKMFYYNPESFSVFSAVGKALLEKDCHFRNIQIESSTPEGIAEELQVSGISSIIWCARDVLIPKPVIKAVTETGISMVCDIPGCSGASVVREDFESILHTWGVWMKKHRMKNLLIYLMPWHCHYFLEYFRKNHPELNVKTAAVGSKISRGTYDLILTDTGHLQEISGNAKDWREQPDAPGCFCLPDWEKISKGLVKMLLDPRSKTELKIKPLTKEG